MKNEPRWKAVIDALINESKNKSGKALDQDIPFIEIYDTWLQAAIEILRRKVILLLPLIGPEAFSSLQSSLVSRMHLFASATIALELASCKISGRLRGETPEERYQVFITFFLQKKNLQAFFSEYFILAEILGNAILQWVENSSRFLSRLKKDTRQLMAAFNEGKPLGEIVKANFQSSDFHNKGQSVLHLEFSSGLKLLYKPKDLTLTILFHEMLEGLAELGLNPTLKSYKVLNKKGYGWEEHVRVMPCESEEQIDLYYERAGIYLGLFYLLYGWDLHYENVIASGSHPVVVDTECLFCSNLRMADVPEDAISSDHSVLAVGMLPMLSEGDNKEKKANIGGLINDEGKPLPFLIHRWQGLKTDELYQELYSPLSERGEHHLVYQDKVISPGDHVEAMMSGFKKLYLIIQKNQNYFLDHWLEKLSQVPVRVVPRSTYFYSSIMMKLLWHPSTLRSKKELRKTFEILRKGIFGKQKQLAPLLREERKALLRGDVPYFIKLPNDLDVSIPGKKKPILKNSMATNGYQRALERIQKMDEIQLEEQLSYIQLSLYAIQQQAHRETYPHSYLSAEDASAGFVTQGRIESFLKAIANDLMRYAQKSKKGHLYWLAPEPNPITEEISLRPMSFQLYGGVTGVALFFAGLSVLLKDSHWKDCAIAALKTLSQTIDDYDNAILVATHSIGGFSGVGGMIYGLFHTGRLLEDKALIKRAEKLARSIKIAEIKKDSIYDVIGGASGLLLSLLSLYSYLKKDYLLDLAESCAEHLCDQAIVSPNGAASWKGSMSEKSLLGFSHGTAGYAYALLKFCAIKPNPKVHKMALAAMHYERLHFSKDEGNWLNYFHTPPVSMCAWCHGATGVALGRIGSAAIYKDHELEKEIKYALHMTEENLLETSRINLCCGIFGRVETLMEASKRLNDPSLEQKVWAALHPIFNHFEKVGGVTKAVDKFFNPGLMQGISGVGFTLLRLIDKENLLPQVLLLE